MIIKNTVECGHALSSINDDKSEFLKLTNKIENCYNNIIANVNKMHSLITDYKNHYDDIDHSCNYKCHCNKNCSKKEYDSCLLSEECDDLLTESAENVVSSLEELEIQERFGELLGLTESCPGYSEAEVDAFLYGLFLSGKSPNEIKRAFTRLQFIGSFNHPEITDEFAEQMINYKFNDSQKSDFRQFCKKLENQYIITSETENQYIITSDGYLI